jgi:hypothetical protein
LKSLSVSVTLALAAGLGSTDAPASIVLSVGSETVSASGIATVDLDISGLGGGTALGTYDVNVGFNSNIINFSSAAYGDPSLGDQLGISGPSITSTTLGTGTTELFELSLDSPGTLLASQATSFTLAELMFNAVATGTSPLTLSVNALGDQNGSSLTASLQNGSITVVPPAVPLPASWLLMGSGLLGLGALAQRRRVIG